MQFCASDILSVASVCTYFVKNKQPNSQYLMAKKQKQAAPVVKSTGVVISPEMRQKIAAVTGLTYLADNLEKMSVEEAKKTLKFYGTTAEAQKVIENTIIPAITGDDPGPGPDPEPGKDKFSITIQPVPEDAHVEINGGATKMLENVPAGIPIKWEVSKEGYESQEGTITLTNHDVIQVVELVELSKATLTINVEPADAVVKMNGEVRNSLTVLSGEEIVWEVSKEGYVSQAGRETMISNKTKNIKLEQVAQTVSEYEFEMSAPETIIENTEVELDATFKTKTVGDVGVDKVQFRYGVDVAPEDGHVTFKATDAAGKEYTFVDNGTWGPATGFDIPAEYNATTKFTVIFSKAGAYKLHAVLAKVADDSVVVEAESTVVVAEPVQPEVSEYKISVDVPASIQPATEVAINATLATEVVGKAGVDGVQLQYEIVEAPEDGHMTFTATDSQGQPWTFEDSGVWGPDSGFAVPAEYNATTEFKCIFSKVGNYKLHAALVKVADKSVVTEATVEAVVAEVVVAAKRKSKKA